MKLYDHQKKIIDEDPMKCGLFLGTGSGKTRIALLLAKGDTLIICPKTQKEDKNWEREYRTIAEELVKGYKKGENIKTFKPTITVMSKEEFRRDSHLLARFHTVIVDEAHTCLGVTPNTRQRNRQTVPKASQLFDALDAFIARTKPDRIYLATATIVKSPFTVWAARWVLGKIKGDKLDSFLSFRETFYVRLPMPGRDVYAPKRDAKTKDKLALLVRGTGFVGRLEDYIDMPEQVFKTEYVELNNEQKARIKRVPIEWPDPLVGALKKHCIENGVLNGDEYSDSEEFNNQKLEKILDYAIEFPRMIVFAKYRAQINQLEKALLKEKKTVYTLTGDTKDRGSLILAVKKGLNYVLICQSGVSAGWEAPDCPVVIFASLDFSLVNYVQSIGRISRINNPKRNLYIHLVAKGCVDEHVYKTVVNTKMDFHLAQFVEAR